jgi:nitrate/nitrite transport system substrate-binding protein
MGAVLKACRWLDDLKNRQSFAETLAKTAYVNTQASSIRSRLIGQYDLGGPNGFKEFGPDNMAFFRNGAVNFPRRAHATWFLAQYERLGLAKSTPDYANLPSKVILTDLYAEVAAAEKLTVPADDMSPFTVKLDGVEFDPRKPSAEAARKL